MSRGMSTLEGYAMVAPAVDLEKDAAAAYNSLWNSATGSGTVAQRATITCT